MRNTRSYRRFYARIRRATDTRAIGELMKQAYGARQDGNLSVKHFIALNTAADNQRERLLSAPGTRGDKWNTITGLASCTAPIL
jgi:hypothetical protein